MALITWPEYTGRIVSKALWISDRRLYLNAKGEIVGHNDPNKITLLVPEGGTLPLEDAHRFGLVRDQTAETVTPASSASLHEAPDNSESASETVKRGPGRPRKTINEESAGE